MEGSSPIPDLTIYNGHALMLAQVLRLDFDNRGLNVAPKIGRITKQPPTDSAVTAIPEPGTMALFSTGCVVLLCYVYRRR